MEEVLTRVLLLAVTVDGEGEAITLDKVRAAYFHKLNIQKHRTKTRVHDFFFIFFLRDAQAFKHVS